MDIMVLEQVGAMHTGANPNVLLQVHSCDVTAPLVGSSCQRFAFQISKTLGRPLDAADSCVHRQIIRPSL